MGKIVSISNQKGGVGKTTTSINLAANLASIGKKVLIIDMDPQGNSGSGLGIEINTLGKTSYELLLGESSTNECIQRTNVSNLHIIPSNINLSGAEADLLAEDQREYRLKNAVSELRAEYDYILIDCPLHWEF